MDNKIIPSKDISPKKKNDEGLAIKGWGYLTPIANDRKRLELVDLISFLTLKKGEIEILQDCSNTNNGDNQQQKKKDQNFRKSLRLLRNQDTKETLVQCMDESIEFSLFNKKINHGEIKYIQEGDILCFKFVDESSVLKLNYIFSLNKEIDELQRNSKEHGQEIDIREENRILKKKISQIKQMDENLEHDLNCPICLELMHNPMTTIDCLHSFCGDCLSRVIYMNSNINKSCPTCRQPITDIKQNPILCNIIEKHLQLYPEVKKEQTYYQNKDKENNSLIVQQLLRFHNQIQLQRNYHVIREEDQEGVRFCAQMCSLLIMVLLYYFVALLNKTNQNK